MLYILAVIAEVNAQIHEVVFAKARLVHNLLKHCLINFVWDVTKHDLVCISVGNLNNEDNNLL